MNVGLRRHVLASAATLITSASCGARREPPTIQPPTIPSPIPPSFAAPTEEPHSDHRISYNLDVAGILLIRCSGCHGPNPWWSKGNESGLDITSYEALMKGGNLGPAIIPGKPDESLLIKYVESKVIHMRMPFHGAPLPLSSIDLLKRWISDGAKDDDRTPSTFRIILPNVPITNNSDPAEDIMCRIPVESYATITVTDSATNKILTQRTAPIHSPPSNNQPKDLGRATEAASWLRWSLNPRRDDYAPDIKNWPKLVNVELSIKYNAGDLTGTEFGILREHNRTQGLATSTFQKNPASLTNDGKGTFHYRLDADADVDIEIVPYANQLAPIFRDRKADLQAGLKQYTWNLVDSLGNKVVPGAYVARFRSKSRKKNIPVGDVCLGINVLP